MVYVAVKNIPIKIALNTIVRQLSKILKEHFEALLFKPGPKQSGTKICYLSVAKNARNVIESINRHTHYTAVTTSYVPSMSSAMKQGKGKAPRRPKPAQRKTEELRPDTVFVLTHSELLTEMQSKYCGLFNLSKKTGHKLIEGVARKLFERLKEVADSNPEALETGFKLSSAYRRLHPHFGDFTLILSTLHRLQDAAGAPRTQMVESDLISTPAQPLVVNNVPLDKVQAISAKYADKICKKIVEHIKNLDTEFTASDSDENLAQKKVREELKNLSPYMPLIVKEVIKNHFIPRKAIFHKVRIYGEPFLPNKDIMFPLLKRVRGTAITRSDRMYNMLKCSIPLNQYSAFMQLDGTVVSGAKLVTRSSDMVLYKARNLVPEMRAHFGVEHTEAEDIDLEEPQAEPDAEDMEVQ